MARADLSIGREPKGNNLRCSGRGHRTYGRIICVEKHCSGTVDSFDKLLLRATNRIHRAECGKVRSGHSSDNAEFGLTQFREMSDVATPAGPKFQHGKLMFRFELQKAERYSNFVVEIARTLQPAKLRTQDCCNHLSRCGFANAAGHGRYECRRLTTIPRR